MAVILGFSKKTLVEIEKGRTSLGWTGSVALCAIFSNSQVLNREFGGNANEIMLSIALEDSYDSTGVTVNKRIWWQTILENDKYIIQQNVFLQHYRILDKNYKKISTAYDLEELLQNYYRKG